MHVISLPQKNKGRREGWEGGEISRICAIVLGEEAEERFVGLFCCCFFFNVAYLKKENTHTHTHKMLIIWGKLILITWGRGGEPTRVFR